MRLLKIAMVLALVAMVSSVAYAETQSVKVSGDITVDAFARDNYLLNSNAPEANAGQSSNWATFLMSTAEVQIDADLTDNVAGVVRLVNQRNWGDSGATNVNTDLIRLDSSGTEAGYTVANGVDSFQVNVDLAYIELKEFLYSPLTLRIGRQDLWFGKGFIVGANMNTATGTLYAQEYTALRAFDAVRATLDYDPWTIDAVYAKISENNMRSDDDVDLAGVNIGYLFDAYNGEAEGYYWWKQARNPGTPTAAPALTSVNGVTDNSVHVLGLRGSFDPIEDWTIAAEGAYQLGQYMIASQTNKRNRSAWAVDAQIECRYFQDRFAWRPVVDLEYIWYSGQNEVGDQVAGSAGKWNGWDNMFRGKFDTKIREWQNVYYDTSVTSTPANTNQHQLLLSGSIEPTDSLTCGATFGYFWLEKRYTAAATTATSTGKNVGAELDLNATWDYTEDVQFGILAAWFFPGSAYDSTTIKSDIATDIVGTVALSF